MTQGVKFLIVANVAFFVVQNLLDRFFGWNLLDIFALSGSLFSHFFIWQIVSYSFLHANVMHLVFNMIALVFLGRVLEPALGLNRFLFLYGFSSVMGGLCYLLAQFLFGNLAIPLVGASAGVFGLLAAFVKFYGHQTVLFMFVLPMQAKMLLWLIIGIEILTVISSAGSFYSVISHLGGLAAGFFALKQRKKPKPFRVIQGFKDDDEPKTWH